MSRSSENNGWLIDCVAYLAKGVTICCIGGELPCTVSERAGKLPIVASIGETAVPFMRCIGKGPLYGAMELREEPSGEADAVLHGMFGLVLLECAACLTGCCCCVEGTNTDLASQCWRKGVRVCDASSAVLGLCGSLSTGFGRSSTVSQSALGALESRGLSSKSNLPELIISKSLYDL